MNIANVLTVEYLVSEASCGHAAQVMDGVAAEAMAFDVLFYNRS